MLFDFQNKHKARYNIFGSYIFSSQEDYIAAYGSKRTNYNPNASEIPVSDNLFERTNEVLNTEFLLKTLEGNEELTPFKEQIIQAFLKLIPRLSRIEFVADESGTSKKVLYFEKDEDYKSIGRYKYPLELLTSPFEITFLYVKADYQPLYAFYGAEYHPTPEEVSKSAEGYIQYLDSLETVKEECL